MYRLDLMTCGRSALAGLTLAACVPGLATTQIARGPGEFGSAISVVVDSLVARMGKVGFTHDSAAVYATRVPSRYAHSLAATVNDALGPALDRRLGHRIGTIPAWDGSLRSKARIDS